MIILAGIVSMMMILMMTVVNSKTSTASGSSSKGGDLADCWPSVSSPFILSSKSVGLIAQQCKVF